MQIPLLRLVVVATLATACWGSSATRTESTGADHTKVELAASHNEVQTLRRRLKETEDERDGLTQRLDAIQARLKEAEAVATPPPTPTPPRRFGPDPAKTFSVPLGKWPRRGPADAKVTMVVASEYACPYCEKARGTLDDLMNKYGKDLRIVFKQLVVHPRQATASALAVCAAQRQNKFDKLDPLLWEKGFKARSFDTDTPAPDGTLQECWTQPAGCPIVLGLATEAGLDVSRFKTDMQRCEAELKDTQKELQQLGVSATPGFFINGRFMSGAQPIENFATLIDEELAKANDRIKKGARKARYYQEWVIERGEKTAVP
ncbi:MAG: thioredoxin domain-containing protein [Kofleriaceae bacterium]